MLSIPVPSPEAQRMRYFQSGREAHQPMRRKAFVFYGVVIEGSTPRTPRPFFFALGSVGGYLPQESFCQQMSPLARTDIGLKLTTVSAWKCVSALRSGRSSAQSRRAGVMPSTRGNRSATFFRETGKRDWTIVPHGKPNNKRNRNLYAALYPYTHVASTWANRKCWRTCGLRHSEA